MSIKLPWAVDLSGKTFAFFGAIRAWPGYHGMGVVSALRARSAAVNEGLSDELDYVVFGEGREKGRAAALRKAGKMREKGASFEILDETAFIYLMRPKLGGTRFHFAGELGLGQGVSATSPEALVATLGAEYSPKVDADLDFLVLCDRRAKGKAAAIRTANTLKEQGAKLRQISEEGFMELLATQAGAPETAISETSASPLAELVVALPGITDPRRIKRALDMLRKQTMQLYVDVDEEHAAGIVRSQTGYSDYYSTRLEADGRYSCCDSDLYDCMGMGGKVCKHLLVLMLGLVQSGQLPAATARTWLAAANKRRPPTGKAGKDMEQLLAETILRYKAAEAGELDWRPTETVPEDYFAY